MTKTERKRLKDAEKRLQRIAEVLERIRCASRAQEADAINEVREILRERVTSV